MPIYDYRCDHCGHAFSSVQSFGDAPLEACPQCGERPRKLLSQPAIVFKGSGWYKTDSRAASPKPAKEDAAPAEAKPGGTTADATEAKPAAAKDTPAKGAAS